MLRDTFSFRVVQRYFLGGGFLFLVNSLLIFSLVIFVVGKGTVRSGSLIWWLLLSFCWFSIAIKNEFQTVSHPLYKINAVINCISAPFISFFHHLQLDWSMLSFLASFPFSWHIFISLYFFIILHIIIYHFAYSSTIITEHNKIWIKYFVFNNEVFLCGFVCKFYQNYIN